MNSPSRIEKICWSLLSSLSSLAEFSLILKNFCIYNSVSDALFPCHNCKSKIHQLFYLRVGFCLFRKLFWDCHSVLFQVSLVKEVNFAASQVMPKTLFQMANQYRNDITTSSAAFLMISCWFAWINFSNLDNLFVSFGSWRCTWSFIICDWSSAFFQAPSYSKLVAWLQVCNSVTHKATDLWPGPP